MARDNSNTEEISDDESILRELEKEDDYELASLREKRLSELKKEMQEWQEIQQHQYGSYLECTEEKEVLHHSTHVPRCVVHFYHSDFKRCSIMDSHLEKLAKKHRWTKFIRVSVEKCPFLVSRLKIQVLPCLLSFVEGISVDRLVGFEELGGSDTFPTSALEQRLINKGVIQAQKSKASQDYGEVDSDFE